MEPKDDARPMMTPVKADDGDVVIVMECFLNQVPAEAMESKNLAFARSEKRKRETPRSQRTRRRLRRDRRGAASCGRACGEEAAGDDAAHKPDLQSSAQASDSAECRGS